MAFYRCAGGTDPTGNAGTGDVLAGKTFSNADGIDKTGTMTNRGAVTQSLNTSTTSYTIPAGYHNGSGKVSITTQEKTVTSSRSAQTVTPDSGKVLSKVTVKALAPTGTYKPTSRVNNNDMGATGNYRYVDTTAVPNSNSGTYTYAANSTGGTVDMGATNTYRYVNAANVYTKGKADGVSPYSSVSFTIRGVSEVQIQNPNSLPWSKVKKNSDYGWIITNTQEVTAKNTDVNIKASGSSSYLTLRVQNSGVDVTYTFHN